MKNYLILVLLTFSVSVVAQPLTSKAIDDLATRSMKAFNVPGIAVAVIKDGQVIHAKGYGVRSLNTMQPVDENTLFGIASNSKAFCSATLGILVDEGKIKWDDKVRDYIPEFKLYNPYVTEEFTIRDLLTHRSGMGLGAGDLMFFPDSSDFTLKDIIYNLRHLKPVSGFRSKYDYDNNLYIVAGEVVSRVTGMSWEDFVEQRIIQPLGMNRTAASYERLKDKANVIDGHAPVNGKVQVVKRNTLKVGHAAGGLNSSIADLSKWVLLQLNHGKYGEGNKKVLFSDNVHEEMWTPQTIIPVRNPGTYNTHFSAYALGFGVSDVKGYKQVTHTGGLEGMVTQITMIPELNLGIIVLTNQQEGGAFVSITNQIKDGYFGMTGTDRVKEYSGNRNAQVSKVNHQVDSIWQIAYGNQKAGRGMSAADLTGTYNDPWFGDVVISVRDGKIWFASKRSPRIAGELIYFGGNTMLARWKDRSLDADCYVDFVMNESGKAKAFTMHAISPLTDFSYDFQDLSFSRKQ